MDLLKRTLALLSRAYASVAMPMRSIAVYAAICVVIVMVAHPIYAKDDFGPRFGNSAPVALEDHTNPDMMAQDGTSEHRFNPDRIEPAAGTAQETPSDMPEKTINPEHSAETGP